MKIRSKGFTLIELLIVVAIAAVLASLAVPSFRTMLVKRSVQSAALSMVSDLRYARTEALRRSSRVSMCSLAANSTSSCSGIVGAWTNGWIVFVDLNGDGVVDAGEDIVRVQQAPANITSIQSLAPINDRKVFKFEANGWARSADQTFIVTPAGSVPANTTRVICISLQGRPSLRAEGASAC